MDDIFDLILIMQGIYKTKLIVNEKRMTQIELLLCDVFQYFGSKKIFHVKNKNSKSTKIMLKR